MRVGRREMSVEAGYERLAAELQVYVREIGYDQSAAGYLSAALRLREHAFPEWPLNGIPYDTSDLPVADNEVVSIARAIGIFLALAKLKLVCEEKAGSELVFDYIFTIGVLPLDCREY